MAGRPTDKPIEATPVKQALMLLTTLPRVAGLGETIQVPVNVFVSDKSIQQVIVSIATEGDVLTTAGATSQKIDFNGATDQLVFFELKAKDVIGKSKIKVTARSGAFKPPKMCISKSETRTLLSTKVIDKVLEAGESWQADYYQPVGTPGTQEAYLELSAMPPLNIEKHSRYLMGYPHGCIEQTTSKAFPQLYLAEFMELSNRQLQLTEANVKAAINKISSFQRPERWFYVLARL